MAWKHGACTRRRHQFSLANYLVGSLAWTKTEIQSMQELLVPCTVLLKSALSGWSWLNFNFNRWPASYEKNIKWKFKLRYGMRLFSLNRMQTGAITIKATMHFPNKKNSIFVVWFGRAVCNVHCCMHMRTTRIFRTKKYKLEFCTGRSRLEFLVCISGKVNWFVAVTCTVNAVK